MPDDFERLAAKGREQDAERERDAGGRSKQPRRDITQDPVVLRSLGDSVGGLSGAIATVAVIVLGIVGGLHGLRALDLPETARIIGLIALVVVLGAGGYLATTQVTKLVARMQLGWLRRIPFGLDVDGYLRALSGSRRMAKATVTVSFEHDLDDTQKEAVSAAVAGAVDTSERRWDGESLVVVSPRIQAHFDRGGTDAHTGTFSNRLVHAWVRKCLGRGLAAVHRRHPIESVRIVLGS